MLIHINTLYVYFYLQCTRKRGVFMILEGKTLKEKILNELEEEVSALEVKPNS